MSKKRNKQTKPKQETLPQIEGVISIAANGVGYVDLGNEDQDVQIQPQFLNTALHRDQVEIALLPELEGGTRIQGEVIRVIKRAKDEFVGTIDKKDPKKNFAFVVADDTRTHTDIFIPDAKSKDAKDGYKVLVKITDWGGPKKNPSGRILKVLGKKGDNNVEMESILLESGYRPEFPEEVVQEAKDIQKQAKPIPDREKARRRDCTSIPTFTIDPDDAKDLDDALSMKKLDADLFEVGIHIADVSHYVKEGSAIDLHARDKGTSVYLVDRSIPMLPEELSSDICSLNPQEEKLTFSVILTIAKDGTVRDRWFGRTVIRPDARFSYEEAQHILDTGEGAHAQELRDLNAIAEHLRKQSGERGALDFEQPEVKFDLDKNGKPIRVYEKAVLPAHRLIEQFMVLANREVAQYCASKAKQNGGPAVFRIHEPPAKKNMESLFGFLEALGYEIQASQQTVALQELNAVFDAVHGTNEEYLVETMALRNMEKAIYSLDNKGHFGLALDHYTHFTSPIRRYADLMVHRILHGHLTGKPVSEKEREHYKKILDNLTRQEISAMEAERNSVRYKQIEYMLQRKGQTYEGIITNVFAWGIFIQETKTKADGLVRTRDMRDDYYTLDEENYTLIGTRTKKKYAIGDTVQIKVMGGDIDQKTLDYKLVS